jgi:hypothetical protein
MPFGIGTQRTLIGSDRVDLQVLGGPGTPATARTTWRTPAEGGHYCLQVELEWADDANPSNNLGQENTDVKSLNSPHAHFDVPVRNNYLQECVLRLEVDAYQIPARQPCQTAESKIAKLPQSAEQVRQRRLARHARDAYPVPDGWTVTIDPDQLQLRPGEEAAVAVDVVAPDGFDGQQSFNLNAFDGSRLVGGVTLSVRGPS